MSQVFRTFIFHPAEPAVIILIQTYACYVFPKMTMAYKKTCEDTYTISAYN